MPGIIELGEEVAGAILVVAPWASDIPVLGHILTILHPGGGSDLQALEQLQKISDARKTEVATRIARNGRYVLKASDAMQCVHDSLENAGFLLALIKGVFNVIVGRPTRAGPNILADKIYECIERKVLKQSNPRVRSERVFYHRPARGHGRGRVSGKARTPPPPESG